MCSAIVIVLLPKHVTFPSGENLNAVVQGFKERHGFPQCADVIDGSHIPIVSLAHYPADYFNRKGWHSVILHGTVNHLGQFTDINVDWAGLVEFTTPRSLPTHLFLSMGKVALFFPTLHSSYWAKPFHLFSLFIHFSYGL